MLKREEIARIKEMYPKGTPIRLYSMEGEQSVPPGSRGVASDVLSAVALMEADTVLRLINCDLKSISYLSSQLPLLRDNKWDADKQLKVASNVKQQEASSHMEQVLGSVSFQIPHSREVETQYLEGDMLAELGLKESRAFRKEIEKISKEVFGV